MTRPSQSGRSSRPVIGSGIEADRCTTLREYLQSYVNAYVNVAEAEVFVNDQMAAFEEREQKRAVDKVAMRGVADKDGFVTVMNGNKGRAAAIDVEVTRDPSSPYFNTPVYDPFAPLRAALSASMSSEDSTAAAKTGLRPLDNFYRFQVRRRRATELDDLKRKFEDDKRRLEQLKKSKLFANGQ